MTSTNNQPDPAIEAAAAYIVAGRVPGEPIVSDLRTRFGLTSVEACEAIRRANEMRGYASRPQG